MTDDQAIFLSELRVAGGSDDWCWVRWELFIFRNIRDVLPTHERDCVLIVHRGRAQPERWLQALGDAGFDSPRAPRRREDAGRDTRPLRSWRDRQCERSSELQQASRKVLGENACDPIRDSEIGGPPSAHAAADGTYPLDMAPPCWSAARRRTIGAGFALSAVAVGLVFGKYAPLIALATITGISLAWIAACLGELARSERPRSELTSPRPIADGTPPIMRFLDARPRVVCAGWLQPHVYVSTGALLDLAHDDLRAALEHQRHHARRRDPLRLVLMRALADGLPFLPILNPLVARYARRLEIHAEIAAGTTSSSAGGNTAACPIGMHAETSESPGNTTRADMPGQIWAVAVTAALATLMLHASNLIDLAAFDPTAGGAQLCLAAVTTLLVLGAATALQTDPARKTDLTHRA